MLCIEHAPQCVDLGPTQKLIVFIIFMVGGPFFMISALLEQILGLYLPEDWNDDEDER